MDITQARKTAHAAYRNLLNALENGQDATAELAALNKAKTAAERAGATEHAGHVTIVNGKPFSPTTITPERAAEVMANAARANAR